MSIERSRVDLRSAARAAVRGLSIHTMGKLSAHRHFRLVGNAAWSLANQGFRTATLGIVFIVFARYLGPKAFGTFALAFAIVRIFGAIAGFALERLLVQRLVTAPAEARSLIRSGVLIRTGSSVLGYAASLGCAWLMGGSASGLTALTAVIGLSLFLNPADVLNTRFQADGRMKRLALAQIVPIMIATGLKLAAVASGASLWMLGWFEAIEALLIGASVLLAYFSAYRRPTGPAGPLHIRGLMTAALPLLISSLAVILYMRTDLVILGILSGSTVAGTYSAAIQLTEIWAILPLAIAPAILPGLVALRAASRSEWRVRMQSLFQMAALVSVGIAVLVTIAAPLIVPILFGSLYHEAVPVLQIRIWCVVFIFFGPMQTLWDVAENQFWVNCSRNLVGTFTCISLNLFLIPQHGAAGAAVATLAGLMVATFLVNAVSTRTRELFWLQANALLLVPAVSQFWRRGTASGESRVSRLQDPAALRGANSNNAAPPSPEGTQTSAHAHRLPARSGACHPGVALLSRRPQNNPAAQ
jgi:O-antigen/teichoic acid export membrane protein